MNIKFDTQDNNPLVKSYLNDDVDKFRQLIKEGMNVNCYYNCNNTLISLIAKNDSKIPYNSEVNICISALTLYYV